MKTKLFENINGNQFKLAEDGHDETGDTESRYETGIKLRTMGKNTDTPMDKPEEKREVQIGRTIINICKDVLEKSPSNYVKITRISNLAKELITMHGAK